MSHCEVDLLNPHLEPNEDRVSSRTESQRGLEPNEKHILHGSVIAPQTSSKAPVEIGTQRWYTERESGLVNILILLDLRAELANPLLGTISLFVDVRRRGQILSKTVG
jgi:hypothetical protein